jgi:hypothetical protein
MFSQRSSLLKMEKAVSFETLTTTYQITWQQIPEGSNHNGYLDSCFTCKKKLMYLHNNSYSQQNNAGTLPAVFDECHLPRSYLLTTDDNLPILFDVT